MSNYKHEEVIIISKKSVVNQRSVNDCGVACLTNILNLNGINVSYDDVKSKIKMEQKGVSAYEIIRVSKDFGLNAVGYKNYDINDNKKTPFIAHILNGSTQHFVVVRKILNDNVYVDDPDKGKLCIKKDDFNKIYTGIALVFNKNQTFNLKGVFNKKYILLISFIILFLSLLNVFYSYFLSYLIENFKSLNNVFLIILAFFILGLLKEFVFFIKNKFLVKYQIKTDKMITIPSLKRIIKLPHKFYQEKSVGELMAKINDLSYVKEMVFLIAEVLFVNLIVIFVSFIFLLFINKYVFLFNLLMVILLFLYNKHFYFENSYRNYDLQIKNEMLSKTIAGGIQSIFSIKNLCKEKYLQNKMVSSYKKTINCYKNLSLLYQNKGFVFNVCTFICLVLSILLIAKTTDSVATMLFMTYLISIIYDSLEAVCKLIGNYTDFKSAYVRFKEIFKEPECAVNGKPVKINNICLNNVYYKIEKKKFLKKINVQFEKGELIMVTGPSGSGKTTFFKVLTKQVDSSNNGIFINGVKLNEYKEGTLRKSITYVDQKARLLNDTIYENITLGEKMKLKKSFKTLLDKSLDDMKMSYDDEIDNVNSNISGGELSLILIAQALNNSADVIIFDETTSQMDAILERDVIKALKEDYKDKIIVFVTHNMTNADLFDKVLDFPDKENNEKRSSYENFKRKRVKTN